MIFFGQPGPLDLWETEIEKLSHSGLVHMVKSMHTLLPFHRDRGDMLASVRSARKIGRSIDACHRYDKFKADPDAAIAASVRRQRAAKKAARRRKRASK